MKKVCTEREILDIIDGIKDQFSAIDSVNMFDDKKDALRQLEIAIEAARAALNKKDSSFMETAVNKTYSGQCYVVRKWNEDTWKMMFATNKDLSDKYDRVTGLYFTFNRDKFRPFVGGDYLNGLLAKDENLEALSF